MRRALPGFIILLLLALGLFGACSLPESGLGTADALPPESGLDAAPDVVNDAAVDVTQDASPESGPLQPDQLTSLTIWLRADKGVISDGGVDADSPLLAWNDSSSSGDVNRNALTVGSTPPTLIASNPAFAGAPTVHFESGQLLQTGIFSSAITQPCTAMVVAVSRPGGASDRYFLASLSGSTPFSLYAAGTGQAGAATDSIQRNAGLDTTANVTTATAPTVVVAVYDGVNSRLYVSANQAITDNPGTNNATGLTIGNWPVGGGVFPLKGDIAEVALWSRALPSVEVASLNLYATGRYGITIK